MFHIYPSGAEITRAIFEFPHKPVTPSEITRYLNDGGASSEAKGAVRASGLNLDSRMASDLVARVCLAVVPMKELEATPLVTREIGGSLCGQRYFRGADFGALMVATVGPGVEEECSKLYKTGQYIDALVLDAMASATLARVFKKVREELQLQMPGMKLGFTLQPGGDHLPIGIQRIIFALLKPEDAIGVRLTESMLMIPVKSTSALIPMGTKLGLHTRKDEACCICSKRKTCSAHLT